MVSDPIKAFLDIATEPTDYESEPDVSKEELYEGYKQFCTFYKLPVQSYDPFCKSVKTKGVQDGREPSGDRKRVWKEIRLKRHLFQDSLTV